ncbi:MAG: hypothetical protein Q8Q31_05940 [Nanoarchaeota archaeon]|nr:hypothetical protein [Nanoarchaeota archaeon]
MTQVRLGVLIDMELQLVLAEAERRRRATLKDNTSQAKDNYAPALSVGKIEMANVLGPEATHSVDVFYNSNGDVRCSPSTSWQTYTSKSDIRCDDWSRLR